MVDSYYENKFNDLKIPRKLYNSTKNIVDSVLIRVLDGIKSNLLTPNMGNSRNSNYVEEMDTISEEDEDKYKIYSPIENNKVFVAKLARERQEREKKRQDREEKSRKKLEEEFLTQEAKKHYDFQMREEEKKKRLEDLAKKKESRKKQLDFYKDLCEKDIREILINKPLYIKLEENYEESVLMPELERKKAELARKRELFQPLKKQELQEHIKRYNEVSHENQARREAYMRDKMIEFRYNNSACTMKSKFTDNFLEEERKRKEELEKLENERKILREKKKKYASLVKEMFVPSIDEFKRQEMILIQEKMKHPVRLKLMESQCISEDTEVAKKKWKKNTMVPEPKPRREGKIVDYLAEKRRERDNSTRIIRNEGIVGNSSFANEDKIEFLRRKAENLEREAFKQERKAKSVATTEKSKIHNHTDDLLLGSIKAKLEILNKNISN